jgi:hypothetical protein
MEAHGFGMVGISDRVKQAMVMESDRPIALREGEARLGMRRGGPHAR